MRDTGNPDRCGREFGQRFWVERHQNAMRRLYNLAALCIMAENRDGHAFTFSESGERWRQRHRSIGRWGRGRRLGLGFALRRSLLVAGLPWRYRRRRNSAGTARRR
jgi:hypothetical protein